MRDIDKENREFWDAQSLGKKLDREIAEATGFSITTVRRQRLNRGLKAVGKFGPDKKQQELVEENANLVRENHMLRLLLAEKLATWATAHTGEEDHKRPTCQNLEHWGNPKEGQRQCNLPYGHALPHCFDEVKK